MQASADLKLDVPPSPASKPKRPFLKRTLTGLAAAGLVLWSPLTQAAAPDSFADLAEEVSPAVVNVATVRQSSPQDMTEAPNFGFPEGSPFGEFFRRFQQQPQQQEPQRSLGSGFIIDEDGLVVTNNHVINGADEISVRLSDGRILKAELIGADPQTDLALLKVQSDKKLPYVAFGDSDEVRVGDWVLAIGNPYGLGGTVTAGIISARSRDINAGPYDDFLQTDASINRGNSGGPMFNMDGEVIGINTAIFSPSGGSIGIGFAIPSNLSETIIAQLKKGGTIERGWLGVTIQPITPDLAEALNLDSEKGALVSDIVPDSPAAAADIKQGDVILSFNGEAVDTTRDLPRLVATTKPGSVVQAKIWRNGRKQNVTIEVGALDSDMMAIGPQGQPESSDFYSEELGATLSPLTTQLKQQLGLSQVTHGAVIVELDRKGRALQQGLDTGDVIQRVGNEDIISPKDVNEHLSKARKNGKKAVILLVNRNGNDLYIGLRLN